MADGKFFTTTKKGEIAELREELLNPSKDKKKDAVKKVIAAMTVGKDVSTLFPDVVKCIQTDNLELKKLVYLYVINYAKTQPELALLAVNTFQKDAQDLNPLIRALAVRTMGCIRVEKITEYLCDPLAKCLEDSDPYVKKTAAICVAKLYDISPELVEDRGFLDMLRNLLSDSNPMVVANAVAALVEINDGSPRPQFELNQQVLFKLLAALNECTEWGQVFILDALVAYEAPSAKDAESVIERISPRLQHANCAVVLSAVKVIMKQMDAVQNPQLIESLCKKMAPPLVTLLSAEPEIQYVALRNINLIIQKRPEVFMSKEDPNKIKVFFCKYNDPIYVKMEKLEIMVSLTNERNIDLVLMEFKEYATEIDVDFVRKAVRAIGRAAISLERAADRCMVVLVELIQTKVNYVVQEAAIVIKDVFRRYPNKYENVITTLCENLDTLDEPEAKASMVWIIGEYADRIDDADELLEGFLETFTEETATVQLQLLTATVKLFLTHKNPNGKPQELIKQVLAQATNETDNPDLRDRAYIYWRLLSSGDPDAARDIVLAEKPVITDDSNSLEPSLLDELLSNMGMLASVYHKPPDAFVSRTRVIVPQGDELADDYDAGMDSSAAASTSAPAAPATAAMPDLMGGLDELAAPPAPAAPAAAGGGDLLGDLLGLDAPAPAAPAAAAASPLDNLLGLGGPAPAPAAPAVQKAVLLPADKGQGFAIAGAITKQGGQPVLAMTFQNQTAGPLDGFQVMFNKNAFCISPAAALQAPAVPPGGSAEVVLPLAFSGQPAPLTSPPALQVAIKSPRQNPNVHYFATPITSLGPLLLPGGNIEETAFLNLWRSIADTNEKRVDFADVAFRGAEAAGPALQAANMFVMASRPAGSIMATYVSALAPPNVPLLLELKYTPGAMGVSVACKSPQPDLAPLVFSALREALLA